MKKYEIEPLYDKVLIRAITLEKKTNSGLILPDSIDIHGFKTGSVDLGYGEVINVGEGIITKSGKKVPLEVEIGDKVYFNRIKATQVKINKNDDDLFIIRHDDIILKS